jgi:hypothetical protein
MAALPPAALMHAPSSKMISLSFILTSIFSANTPCFGVEKYVHEEKNEKNA